jgi:predicted MFS family arabinose efflux permease
MKSSLIDRVEENSIFYPGWGVVAAAFVGAMVSFAAIVPYTFSLFLTPLHAAFGWDREAMGGAFALAAITVAIVSPLLGVLFDHWPPRRIIVPSILAFAAALALLSRLSGSIAQFYLAFFVLGVTANGTASFAYTRTLLTWFRKHRGLALALLLTGGGIGSILLPPLTQWMIQQHGWRSAWLMLGGIALLGLPLTLLLVRNRPENSISQEQHPANGMPVALALRQPSFWILALITILSAFSENGLVTNMAAILTEHGVIAATAALALSVRGGAGILGRLGIGSAIDRASPRRIQTIVLTLAAAGTLILSYARTWPVTLLGAAVLGIGLGSEADVMPYLLARFFGRKHFSVLYGLMWTAYAIGGATGPLWIGHMYDTAHAYKPIFIVELAGVAFAAVILSLLLPDNNLQTEIAHELTASGLEAVVESGN